jgi:peptidoglycan/LPS O-acetylase OafA/YrhL
MTDRPPTTANAPTSSRSRYIDSLRALAITRVYLHHALWFGWLTVVFPSMNVMFALAGYLTAVSIDRSGTVRTVKSRLRRLLPPLWALAALAVPLMLANGWRDDPSNPLRAQDLWLWILPAANPPASTWGTPFALALWYLRAYLWLVLFSPLLWWAFRRRPWITLAALPVAAVLMSTPWLHYPITRTGDVMWATACYGSSWVLGYARHRGLLDRLSWRAIAAIAVALAGCAVVWSQFATPAAPWGFTDPLANMLWGNAFVVVLMRVRPSMSWLDRMPRLSRAVAALNARAVTIYVWHLPMLFAATGVLAFSALDLDSLHGLAAVAALGAVFTAGAIVVTGWVEDVAAKRKPVLVPPAPPAAAGQPFEAGSAAPPSQPPRQRLPDGRVHSIRR